MVSSQHQPHRWLETPALRHAPLSNIVAPSLSNVAAIGHREHCWVWTGWRNVTSDVCCATVDALAVDASAPVLPRDGVMSSWQAEYLARLKARDEKEKANYDLIDSCR